MDGSRSLYTRDYQQYQRQRTKNSMSVSQSPDSVALASASDTTEQQNNNNHSSEVGVAVAVSGNGNANANQFQQQSMQSSSSVSSQQQPRLAKSSNVKNPYLKQAPAETIPLDAKAQERQKFLDKYRLQAIQHNQRRVDRKAGGGSCYSAANTTTTTTTTTIGVTPISALELRRTTHQWRQSWRNGNYSCSMDATANINSNGGNNSCRNGMIMPMPIMRPRLFLLRRHGCVNQQQRQRQTMQQHATSITELFPTG